jgi:hypothetical protein
MVLCVNTAILCENRLGSLEPGRLKQAEKEENQFGNFLVW